MTRDFNKQNRDDSRPPFRSRPSNRYGEERSPRPARVRLNREMVDRAWENGAPSLHADYRARNTSNTNGNGQHSRNNWRSNQNSSPHTSGGNGGNRAYGTRQYNNRDQDAERGSHNGYQSPRNRQSGPYRPETDGPRSNGYQRDNGNPSSYRTDRPRSHGYQRDNTYQGADRPRYNDNQRGPASYRSNSRPGSRPYQGRGPQINKPEGEHPRRGAGRYVHPEKEYRPRPNEERPPREERPPHPRFLSRPEVRRAQEAKRYKQHDGQRNEQFEGDYEQFDSDDTLPQAERVDHRPRKRDAYRQNDQQEQERHVTRLPDGRVLKGPRPVQRRNALFWTDIHNEAEALIDHVQEPDGDIVDVEPGSAAGEAQSQPAGRSPRSTKGGSRNADAPKKPRTSGPRPSQKGYKWPTE